MLKPIQLKTMNSKAKDGRASLGCLLFS